MFVGTYVPYPLRVSLDRWGLQYKRVILRRMGAYVANQVQYSYSVHTDRKYETYRNGREMICQAQERTQERICVVHIRSRMKRTKHVPLAKMRTTHTRKHEQIIKHPNNPRGIRVQYRYFDIAIRD